MSERIDLPAGGTVSADEEAIHFTDSQGRIGEITEYGVVMENARDEAAELGEIDGEYPEPPIRNAAYNPSRDDYSRKAADVYGSRGQVPKAKK